MIICGDSMDVLKSMEPNSVDAIVTDPPYGLAFMGKRWDYNVPSVEFWKWAKRILKPGGYLLSFGGTRTYHRMVVNIEDAGFEIRDQLQWIYGSGFPKSLNIKDGELKGWGTALKPANEPIVLARKPLEGTVAQNVEKWGVGGLNIDGSRIEGVVSSTIQGQSSKQGEIYGADQRNQKVFEPHSQGRWPANVLFDEEAAAMLDEQSGEVKSAGKYKNVDTAKEGGNGMFAGGRINNAYAGETGGASRFFYVAKASKRERNAGLEGELKQKQGARPNSADASGKFPDHDHRPTGGNNHPTVKPVKLMEYLCKLITPPGGVILDPFCGSGSTGVAAKNLGVTFIGIEREFEYFEIAKKRIGE